jgi:hypothetical protein
MLEAMLASLRDRDAAAGLFQAAKADNPDFVSAQLLDQSIETYFTAERVRERSTEIATRRSEFVARFELLEGTLPRAAKSTLLLFSCDPAFFAAFFPYWASLAEYLSERHVYLHFLLVGNRSEAATAVERALAVTNGIARLRGFRSSNSPSSLSFSTVPSAKAPNPKTFFACARYLAASKILADTGGQILILDIDMALREDPTESLRVLREVRDIGLPVVMVRGPTALIPARRYLAGRVFLPSRSIGEQAMHDIEEYIYAGLFDEQSWTLDQNALTYAAERVIAAQGPCGVTDVNRYVGAFRQEPIRLLYRDSQWRRQ